MGKVKQIEIKNRTYYFYNDIINIEEFNSSLLKIDKKSYRDIGIDYIGYTTIKKNWWLWKYLQYKSFVCNDWWSNWTYWKNNGNKYLVFDFTDKNKEVLKKYRELWDGAKNEIKTINGGKKGEYGKDFMKITFNTDDEPLDNH